MDVENQGEIMTGTVDKNSGDHPLTYEVRSPLRDATNKTFSPTLNKSGLGISEAEQRRGGSKGCCVGEDSFVSDKGDQLSESNLCQSKVDTDTDTTAGYESAEESDSSAFGNGSFVICRDGNSTLDIVGAQSSAPDALSVTQLVEDFESLSLQNQADRTLGNDDTAVSGDTITDVSVISTGAEVSICESVPSPVPSNSEQLNDGLRFTSYDVKLPIKESNLLHAGGNSEELNNSYAKDQRASNTAIEKEALPRQGELVKVADADNTISTLVSTEESLISTDFELSCVKRQQTPVNSSSHDQECSTNIVKESEAKEQTALNLSVSKEPFLGIQDIQSDRVVDEIIKSSNEKPSVLNIVIDASIGELVNTNDTGIILNENINAKGDSSFRSGLTSLESSIVEAPVLSSEQLNVSENILPVEHSVGSQVEDSVAEEITVKQHIIEPTVEDTVILKLQESPNVSLSNSESDVDQSILSQKTESNCSDVHDLITLLAAASLSDDKRGIEFDTSNKLSVTNVEESREESISKSSDESVSFKSIAEEVSGKLDDRESKRHFVGLSQTVEPLEISQTSSVEPGEPTDFCEKKVSDDNDAVNDAIEFIETTTPDRSSNDSFNLDKPNKGLSDPDTSSGSYNEASAVHSTTEEKQFALPDIVASFPVNTETIVSEVEETGSQNIKSEGEDIIKVDDVSDLVDSHFKSCKTNQSSLDLHTPTVISTEKTEEVKIIVDEIYENSNNTLVDPSSNCDLIVHQISSVVTVKESPNSLDHKDKNFDTFEVVAKLLLNNSAEIKSDDLSHSSAGFQESTISNFAENFPVDLNNVNEVDVTSNVPADKLSNSCSVNQSDIISGVSHEIESDTRSTDVVPDSPLKDIGKTPVTESGVEILKVDSVNLSGDALPNHSIEELEVAENEIKEVLVAAEDSITILTNLTVAENCFSVQECSITAENNKTEDSLNPANPVQPEPHCHSPGLGLELSNCNTIAKNLSELTSDPSKGRIDISFESLPKNKESEPKGEPTGLANKESYLEPKSHFQSLETSEKITIELNSQESTGVTSENIIPEPKLQNSNLLDADQSDASVQEFRLHSPINLSTRADSLEPVVAEDALKTISKTNSQINFSGKENSLEVKGDTDLHTSFESVENSLSEETTGPLNLTQPINLSSKEKTVVETVAEGLKIYTPIQQVEHTHLSDINSCEPINLSAKEEQYLGESKSQNSEVLAFVEGLKTSDSVELKESASPVQSTKVSDQGLVSLSGRDEKFVNLTKSSELQINPGSIFVSGKEDSLEEVVGEPSLQQSYDISEFDDKVLNKTISQEAPMDLRQKQAKATNRMNGDHPPPVVKVTNRAPIRSAFSSTDSKPLKKQSDSVVKNGKIESVGRGVLDPKKGQEVRQKSKSPTEFDHRTEGKVARAKSKSPVGFADDTATKSSHVGSKVGLTSEGRCGSTTSKGPSPENEMVPAGVEKPSVELGKKLDKPNTHDSEKPKKPAFSGTKASEKSASVQPHQFLEPSNRPVKHITKRSDQEKKNVPLLQKPVEVPVVEIMETEAADSSNVCMMRSAVSPDINRSEAGPVTADENFQEGEHFQEATSIDFEYLSTAGNQFQTGRGIVRESIIVKFDPLYQTGPREVIMDSTESITAKIPESNNKSDEGTPTKSKEDTKEAVQKLISITPCKNDTPMKPRAQAGSITTPPGIRQEILSKEILKLQELMIEQEQSYQEQISKYVDMVQKLQLRIGELEGGGKIEVIEEKLKMTEAKATRLEKELAESTLSKKQLTMIMEEYEKTISQLVTKREDEKKDFEKVKEQIAAERDAALKHLSNMEVAFNDVHQKYERCKTVIENMKVNEASYKESLDANQKAIAKLELDYQKLKKHASEKLEIANEELAGLRKTHSSELARLEAINRKSELSVKSLEESLVQKQKEIRELTQICDELIAKMT